MRTQFSVKIATLALSTLVAVIGVPLNGARAAQAMASIEGFRASCGHFSVAVTVHGLTNDQQGWDRFRYQVTDGKGLVLYREDSVRQVGTEDTSRVASLAYANGARPEANPIRFEVIDLDMLGRSQGTVLSSVVDTQCLAGTNLGSPLESLLPTGVQGSLNVASPLYGTPDGAALPVQLERGRSLTALYRSADAQWIAVYVGGENLVWVPQSAIDLGELGIYRLAPLPTQIDRSQTVSGAVVPGVPIGAATTRYTVRLRQLPTTRAATITRIPFKQIVPVYGRSANSQWVFVSYNGVGGWVASYLVRLDGITLGQLPIVG